MKARVELDPQVAGFVRSLAPEPSECLREGLRGLEQDKGDIKPAFAPISLSVSSEPESGWSKATS